MPFPLRRRLPRVVVVASSVSIFKATIFSGSHFFRISPLLNNSLLTAVRQGRR